MHRAECLAIPGVRDVTLSDSYDIILEIDAEVPDEKLTWKEREGGRLLGGRILVKRRSRDLSVTETGKALHLRRGKDDLRYTDFA